VAELVNLRNVHYMSEAPPTSSDPIALRAELDALLADLLQAATQRDAVLDELVELQRYESGLGRLEAPPLLSFRAAKAAGADSMCRSCGPLPVFRHVRQREWLALNYEFGADAWKSRASALVQQCRRELEVHGPVGYRRLLQHLLAGPLRDYPGLD